MYPLVLLVHSWMRWVVLAAGLVACFRGLTRRGQLWTLADERAGFWFTLALDIQFLLGVLLYFAFSPITPRVFDDFGAAMGDSALRFWAVEHVVGMIIGLALAHIGRARTRRVADAKRHRTAAIFYGLALLAVIAAIPWPGLPNERPLFRGWG